MHLFSPKRSRISAAHFLLPLFALAFLLTSCKAETGDQGVSAEDRPVPSFDGTMLTGKHTVALQTSKGLITLELDADAAPKTVTNFINLARSGYYDNQIFHRVIPGFMLQGGDPTGTGAGGKSIYGDTFEDEINAESYGLHEQKLKDLADEPLSPELENLTLKEYYEQTLGYEYNASLTSLSMTRGAIAMANRGAKTNGSQFFIIQAEETPWLEGRHTVFGTVVSGMDIVDAISSAPRDEADKPLEAVTFTVKVK